MIIADMIWPALYVAERLKHLWYLIFLTIAIEAIIIKIVFKTKFISSILISSVANIVSGLVGYYILPFVLILWHLIADRFLQGTFNTFNWIATFLLMFFGSIFVELIVIKLIWRYDFRRLLTAMVWGNILTYGLTAFLFIHEDYYPSWEPDYNNSEPSYSFSEAIKQDSTVVEYLPGKDTLRLFNGGFCVLDTIWIERKYKSYRNTKNKIYTGYDLVLKFHQIPEKIKNNFLLEFIYENQSTSNQEGINVISIDTIKDVILLRLNQKNPHKEIGWKEPIITDTISLWKKNYFSR